MIGSVQSAGRCSVLATMHLIPSTTMKIAALLIAILGSACAATVGTGGAIYVPRDAAATCSSHCNDIGLALNSVVIMASNVGCVCSAAPAAAGAAVSAGGMSAVLMAAEQQRRNSASSGGMSQPTRH
jgi:hypothetical protein